jgi:hypothetical protein
MSYQADKPFGRRRTDKPMSPDEKRHLQAIRRDVEQDDSGLLRRYLRLAGKVLDMDKKAERTREHSPTPSKLAKSAAPRAA